MATPTTRLIVLHIGYFVMLLVLPLVGGYSVYHSTAGPLVVVLYFIGVTAFFLRRWKAMVATFTAMPVQAMWPTFVSGGVVGATVTLFGMLSLAIGFGLRN